MEGALDTMPCDLWLLKTDVSREKGPVKGGGQERKVNGSSERYKPFEIGCLTGGFTSHSLAQQQWTIEWPIKRGSHQQIRRCVRTCVLCIRC